MKTPRFFLAVIAVAVISSWVAVGAEKAAAGEKAAGGEKMAAKVTGEIVDSSCYIKMGAKGPGHEQCALTCAKAGIPLAMVEDGTDKVVWLAANKDATNVNDQLMPYVAKKVTLTGKWSEKGGTKLFSIDKIEEAK